MALYRFKITFEDYDDVVREIDIRSNQTFEDLHNAIHKSTGYKSDYPSSFYISNDQWIKGEEITYMPNQRRIDRGVALMEKVKLSNRIDDPHQKFYYIFNFDRPFDFHVELVKIILDEAAGVTYPTVVKSVGEAPRQFVPGAAEAAIAAASVAGEADEFDFLNEMGMNQEDTDDFSEVDETGEAVSDASDEEEEEDEFASEFGDDDNYEDEGRSSSRDDY